jgi:hypothetical protein
MHHLLMHVDENVICCISPAVFYYILYLFDCVCVCVCVRARARVCACVYVCARYNLHYMKLWQE